MECMMRGAYQGLHRPSVFWISSEIPPGLGESKAIEPSKNKMINDAGWNVISSHARDDDS
jgi:hypothetical protein